MLVCISLFQDSYIMFVSVLSFYLGLDDSLLDTLSSISQDDVSFSKL